jgi:hypothetical protein
MTTQAPPPGGRRIKPKGDFDETFYTFEHSGDVLYGVLCYTKQIRGEDRYVLEDDHGQRWILPGHVRLTQLLAECQIGERLWIRCDGEQEIQGGRSMKLYSVVAYGPDDPGTEDSGPPDPKQDDPEPDFDDPR